MSNEISVRERVVQQMQRKLDTMTLEANNGVSFKHVVRGELNRTQKFQGNAIAVQDMEEFYTYQTCYLQCNLRVGLEFWFATAVNSVPSAELGKVLAELKRVFMTDINLIEQTTGLQLSENVRILEVDYDVEGPFDRVVSGYLQLEVIYRESKENPYQLM